MQGSLKVFKLNLGLSRGVCAQTMVLKRCWCLIQDFQEQFVLKGSQEVLMLNQGPSRCLCLFQITYGVYAHSRDLKRSLCLFQSTYGDYDQHRALKWCLCSVKGSQEMFVIIQGPLRGVYAQSGVLKRCLC